MSKIKRQPLQKAFGDVVRKLRLERHLTQEKLAELSGLHRTYIGGLELGGRNIALINILRLATALGTEPEDLIALYMQELKIQGNGWKRYLDKEK
jgi:transcriptional regulator with XRE-family HTH domain